MNRLLFYVKFFLKNLMRAVFVTMNGGERCIVCGQRTFFYPLCRGCFKERFLDKALRFERRCRVCGKEMLTLEDVCLACRESSVLHSTDFVRPLFSYRLWNKELMFLWKSQGRRTLSDLFAKVLSEVLRKIEVEIIVPVPPRPGKVKKNGWDQIEELASILKYRYGFKLAPLIERRSQIQQKKLDRSERLQTIGKSYFLKEEKQLSKILKGFNGKVPQRVCIIDDVMTTGSTIESCAALLKGLHIREVYAVTLFTVD